MSFLLIFLLPSAAESDRGLVCSLISLMRGDKKVIPNYRSTAATPKDRHGSRLLIGVRGHVRTCFELAPCESLDEVRPDIDCRVRPVREWG